MGKNSSASSIERTILVIDRDRASADKVKELIEFMDAPSVVAVQPAEWRDELGERRIEALFIGPDLSDGQVSGLLEELAALDPNVPVVVVDQPR